MAPDEARGFHPPIRDELFEPQHAPAVLEQGTTAFADAQLATIEFDQVRDEATGVMFLMCGQEAQAS